jgi:thiamine biosynthesis lipoprotein
MSPYTQYQGYAQGTTFTIRHSGSGEFLDSIQFILEQVDQALSLWQDSSWISRWNRGDQTQSPVYASECLQLALEVGDLTQGAYDPTMLPLSRFWGFGDSLFEAPGLVRQEHIDSMTNMIGFKTCLNLDSLPIVQRKCKGTLLDLNGIAQGYSVDLLAALLDRNGVMDYMIELGGEVRAKGQNPSLKDWQIGIDKPKNSLAEDRPLQAVVALQNTSLATSGSYRKYYERDGKRYSHVLDPATGRPVSHQLLSVSVMHPSCAMADGLATALMVMGPTKARQWAQKHQETGVYLIYLDHNGTPKTWASQKIQSYISELN